MLKERLFNSLPARVRSLRAELSWSQARLAEEAKCSEETISLIEQGMISFPRNIASLAAALQVNPAWLQFGDAYATRRMPVNRPVQVAQ